MAAEEGEQKPECEGLPKLSPIEFRQYNRLAENMNYYV
jgi:hypothetical protein